MATIRLIAKMPTLAAFSYRHNMGLPYVYPDNDLSYSENFLSMLFKMTEVQYEPDPRLAKALDVLFILHADHEQNCSTNAVRAVGSSDVDPYSAVAAGDRRPLRPPARRRQRGGAANAAPDREGGEHPRLPRGRQEPRGAADGLRPPGLQELRPAGTDHQEEHRRGASRRPSYNPLLEIATELEKRALEDDYFTERKLYPNVDFYSGLIYEALRIPTEMFTVIFAIPRTAGWVSQWLGRWTTTEQKIARPRQIYTGPRDQDYVPIDQRGDGQKIDGPRRSAPRALSAAMGRGGRYTLTVRHGSEVEPAKCRDASKVRSTSSAARPRRSARRARWSRVCCLRDFEPAEQVHARLEISTGGLLRGRDAGIDVMGNGALVPFRGGIRRTVLELEGDQSPFEAVSQALAAER